MTICLICYSPLQNFKSLPSCSCTFCSDCLFSWFSLKIHEFSYKSTENLNCPNEFCHEKYSVESLLFLNGSFTEFQSETLEKATFLKYLQNTTDIIECPNPDCNYFGFSNPNDLCKDKYQCEICGNCWQEKTFVPDKIFEKLNRIISGRLINEFLSYVYQELFTENCPECMISISRNGGCYHMTCKNCGFQFCWYCKQKYVGHQLNICMTHMLVKFFILLFVSFWVLGKFDMHVVIWDTFIMGISFVMRYLIFYNLILMVFLLYAIYVYQYFKLRTDLKKRKPEAGVIFFGSISLMVLIFLIRKGYIVECMISWLLETIVVVIAYNFVGLFTLIYNNWISMVE